MAKLGPTTIRKTRLLLSVVLVAVDLIHVECHAYETSSCKKQFSALISEIREQAQLRDHTEISQQAFEAVLNRMEELFASASPAAKRQLLQSLEQRSEVLDPIEALKLAGTEHKVGAAYNRKTKEFYIPTEVYRDSLKSLFLLHEFRHACDHAPKFNSRALSLLESRLRASLLRPSVRATELNAARETAAIVERLLKSPEKERALLSELERELKLTSKESEIFRTIQWDKNGYGAMVYDAYISVKSKKPVSPEKRPTVDIEKVQETLAHLVDRFSQEEVSQLIIKLTSFASRRQDLAFLFLRDQLEVEKVVEFFYRDHIRNDRTSRAASIALLTLEIGLAGAALYQGQQAIQEQSR